MHTAVVRWLTLASTRAEIARVEGKLERYFEAFEEGRLAADLFQDRVRGLLGSPTQRLLHMLPAPSTLSRIHCSLRRGCDRNGDLGDTYWPIEGGNHGEREAVRRAHREEAADD